MNPNAYQALTNSTELHSAAAMNFVLNIERQKEKKQKFLQLVYCAVKLNGEAGECAEAVGKAFRDNGGVITDDLRDKLEKELGDVQWYVAQIAELLDMDLEYIMEQNLDKLQSRKRRGVLSGSGDNR